MHFLIGIKLTDAAQIGLQALGNPNQGPPASVSNTRSDGSENSGKEDLQVFVRPTVPCAEACGEKGNL